MQKLRFSGLQFSHVQKGNRARCRVPAEHLDDAGVKTVSGDTLLLIHDRVQLVNRLAVEKNLTSAS